MDFLSGIDWAGIFLYDPKKPLLFTQFFFWGFFIVVMAIYAKVYKRIAVRNIYLLLCSLFFYYKTGGVFVLLLVFTVASIYWITNWLHRQPDGAGRKMILALGVVVNLLVLFYFKYASFIIDSINGICGTSLHVVNYFTLASNSMLGTNFVTDRIVLPVGISFFTFQAISYCVDVYRRQIEPVKSVLDFGFYVSFFPQLIQGPISRYDDMADSLFVPHSFDFTRVSRGIERILWGYFKKVVIADRMLVGVKEIIGAPDTYFGLPLPNASAYPSAINKFINSSMSRNDTQLVSFL